MKDQCYKIYRIYVVSGGLLALISAVALTLFSYRFYDSDLAVYDHGSPSYAIYIIMAAALLFFITGFFSLKGDLLPLRYPKKNSMLTEIALLLTAVALCATFLLLLLGNGGDRLVKLMNASSEHLAAASVLLKASAVLAVVAAAYYLVSFISEKVVSALAMLAGVWALIYMMRVYYDMSTIVMDPLRMLTIASAAACAMFLLAETRVGIEKPSPRYFVFAGLTATFVCFVSGFSKVAMFLLGASVLEAQTAYDLFELCFGVYAFSRLLAFMKYETFAELEYSASPSAERHEGQLVGGKPHIDNDRDDAPMIFATEELRIGESGSVGDTETTENISDQNDTIFFNIEPGHDVKSAPESSEMSGDTELIDAIVNDLTSEPSDDKTDPEE